MRRHPAGNQVMTRSPTGRSTSRGDVLRSAGVSGNLTHPECSACRCAGSKRCRIPQSTAAANRLKIDTHGYEMSGFRNHDSYRLRMILADIRLTQPNLR